VAEEHRPAGVAALGPAVTYLRSYRREEHVAFDHPETYHFYCGDGKANLGSAMTFFS
jgi:hypothetical protein